MFSFRSSVNALGVSIQPRESVSMASPTVFQFKPLAQCRERQIVRVKINDDAEGAILGDVTHSLYPPLLILSGKNAPLIINVSESGRRLTGDFVDYPVADFGTRYKFVPEYSGRCQIGFGDLFTKPGTLVFVKDEVALIAREQKQVRFFYLTSGTVKGDIPETHRIAYEKSHLIIESLLPNEPLLRFGEQPSHDAPNSGPKAK
jgi:hypothetical protein